MRSNLGNHHHFSFLIVRKMRVILSAAGAKDLLFRDTWLGAEGATSLP